MFPIHFLAVKLDMDTDAEIKKFIILIHIVTWTWNSGIVRQHLLKKKIYWIFLKPSPSLYY